MRTRMLALCLFGFATPAFAEAPKAATKGSEMTTEQRKKMADAHEKMAACLRSDRPVADCHEAMMKSCEESMGTDSCPMMGDGMGKMKHHGKMK